MLWAMKMQEWPESRALRTKFSTPCVSATPRLFVGSSRMMSSLSKYIARAMATAWRSPPESEPIGVVRRNVLADADPPEELARDRVHRRLVHAVQEARPLIGSRPRNRFRAIDSCVTSAESW